MTFKIERVVVIGAGTMGGGIAALVASCSIPVVLLDVVPRELLPEESAKGLTLETPAVRNRIVTQLWDRQMKAKPAALFSPEAAKLVQIGNLEDNFESVRDADWIVEVIVEQLQPKQALMTRIDAIRKPDSIVSSNTSGIPIAQIAEGMSQSFREHFLGTHFFNPPRYLKLLEIIPTADTAPELVAFMRQWGSDVLGKGVVVAKDRPNFIGNRIGVIVGQARMVYAIEHGYSVEETDLLTGPLIGNPSTATFRLADLVGIDVMAHVTDNLYHAVPDDESRSLMQLPDILRQLVQRRALGNKTGAGFYRRTKGPDGKPVFEALNLRTGDYQAPSKPHFPLVDRVIQVKDLGERLRMIFREGAGDRAGDYIINTTLPILAYAARRIPEIADSLADIDNAMRWGFAIDVGPFEMWDMLGVREGAEMMRQRGIAVVPWVDEMVASGVTSFYQRDGKRIVGVYDPAQRQVVPVEHLPFVVVLDERHATPAELQRNGDASLIDLGDGVLCLEYHSKANALTHGIFELSDVALRLLEHDDWRALVIGNQGKNFCVGANINDFLPTNGAGAGDADAAIKRFQDLMMAFRFARKPVVVAPHHKTLGGGAEVAMHGAQRCVASETYMGLVEVGVGLIPGGGGCKELVRRLVSPHIVRGVDPMPYLQQAFETIAYAKVSESAHQARTTGFLNETDRIVMNADMLIGRAKQMALALSESGYRAPQPDAASIYAVGSKGKAVMLTAIQQLRWGKHISEHDALIARKLAHVLCGGDLSAPQWVGEQYMLDLEREAFVSLLGEPKTQQRIAGMLKTGKPVRN
ncbi:MAG: 3-hydroxyacyl-CoA dehydrogenase/enoyl-CoA hydratase family protein [Herpetosiphon sp.]